MKASHSVQPLMWLSGKRGPRTAALAPCPSAIWMETNDRDKCPCNLADLRLINHRQSFLWLAQIHSQRQWKQQKILFWGRGGEKNMNALKIELTYFKKKATWPQWSCDGSEICAWMRHRNVDVPGVYCCTHNKGFFVVISHSFFDSVNGLLRGHWENTAVQKDWCQIWHPQVSWYQVFWYQYQYWNKLLSKDTTL